MSGLVSRVFSGIFFGSTQEPSRSPRPSKSNKNEKGFVLVRAPTSDDDQPEPKVRLFQNSTPCIIANYPQTTAPRPQNPRLSPFEKGLKNIIKKLEPNEITKTLKLFKPQNETDIISLKKFIYIIIINKQINKLTKILKKESFHIAITHQLLIGCQESINSSQLFSLDQNQLTSPSIIKQIDLAVHKQLSSYKEEDATDRELMQAIIETFVQLCSQLKPESEAFYKKELEALKLIVKIRN